MTAPGWPEAGASARGVPAVDAAVDQLADLASRPLTEHVDALDEVHRRLQQALAGLDEA